MIDEMEKKEARANECGRSGWGTNTTLDNEGRMWSPSTWDMDPILHNFSMVEMTILPMLINSNHNIGAREC